MFAVNGPFGTEEDGVIRLTACDAPEAYFIVKDGCITLLRGGSYLVSLTVDVPTGMCADTQIGMMLDENRLALPQLAVTSDSRTATHNYAGHTVLRAGAGSALRLITHNRLVCPHATHHPVITLTLVRIG